MDMYYFIINPLASSGRAAGIWRDLKRYLDKHQIPYQVFMTSYPGHASQIAAQLTSGEERQKDKVIVVLGGDGTLGEVISGVNISSKVSLSFIGAGSGNDFLKANHLAKSPKKRLKQILAANRIEWLDYGVMSYIYGDLQQKRFIVSSGIGLDAAICESLQISPMKPFFNKIHLGRLSYVAVGLRRILREKPFHCTLSLDGGEPMEFNRVRYVSVHVHPYEGGGFRFAPQADNMDGEFDICVVSGVGRLRLIRILLRSLRGRHRGCKGVNIYRCVSASIKTDVEKCIHTDGEICGHLKEFNVYCERRKLKMIL